MTNARFHFSHLQVAAPKLHLHPLRIAPAILIPVRVGWHLAELGF